MADRKKFREVFQEADKSLTLLIKVKVRGQAFAKGFSFTDKEGLAGVDFHKLRYLDIAGETDADGDFVISGFFPQE